MLARARSHICLGAVLLVSAIAGGTHPSTTRLKAISESLRASDITKIRELIKDGADVDVRNRYGVTPLLMASQNGHVEIVKLLLQAKADVDAATTRTGGLTSLWAASEVGHAEIVKLLLEANADVNAARTTDGVTSL